VSFIGSWQAAIQPTATAGMSLYFLLREWVLPYLLGGQLFPEFLATCQLPQMFTRGVPAAAVHSIATGHNCRYTVLL
jgi:hypothetical protein